MKFQLSKVKVLRTSHPTTVAKLTPLLSPVQAIGIRTSTLIPHLQGIESFIDQQDCHAKNGPMPLNQKAP